MSKCSVEGCISPCYRKDLCGRHYYAIRIENEAYSSARQRCTNPKNPGYPNYGGRGIEFRFQSFGQFIDALRTPGNPSGLRPSPEHSLDRKNNNGHYEAGNIRWATIKQ